MAAIIDKLVRPNVKAMKAYQSARGTAQALDGFWLMDAGENPYCPFSEQDDGAAYFAPLNRYPEPQPLALRQKMAELYGVTPENILLTRGSEEAIRILMQAFCTPQKDAILTAPPTFAMYPIEAQIHDVENIMVPRTGDFADHLDVGRIVSIVKDPARHVKVVFICNPGNPSSTALPVEEITELVTALADHAIVVVDEAYIEFAAHESFTRLLGQHPHLMILRTLSKSYGLAGLRCGAILAHPAAIGYFGRLMSAYPVPRPTQNLAVAALSGERLKTMQARQSDLKSERDRMLKALRNCKAVKKVYPSQTNFLSLGVEDAAHCVRAFHDHKIIIRNRSASLPNTVNIAVGTKEQNDRVVEVFESLS